jgi:hypothetical protein
MGVLIVLLHVMNQPHNPSPHFANFPTWTPRLSLHNFIFLTTPPQYHEPSISSIISFPICKFPFISLTSYKNLPMGQPPSTSSPSKLCLTQANHITLGYAFLYLYTYPKIILYLLYKHLCFQQLHYLFVVTFGDLLPFFWQNATHVTLGWGAPYHLPLMT